MQGQTSASAERSSLGSRIRSVLSLQPDAVAIEGAGGKTTWADLAAAARQIDETLRDAQVERNAPIGWVAHNRPAAVAALVSLVMNEHMVVPLRPPQTSATLPEEIAAQRLQAVIADESDWARQDVRDAAAAAGSMGIAVTGWSPITVQSVAECARVGAGPHRPRIAGIVLERLTSGTTGPPKRIPVSEDILIPSLKAGEQSSSDDGEELRLKRSPAILLKPFSHAGGLFGLLLAMYQARPMVLLEKFGADEWANAVRRYQPEVGKPGSGHDPHDSRCGYSTRCVAEPEGGASRYGAARSADTSRIRVALRNPHPIDYGAAEFIGGRGGLDAGRPPTVGRRASEEVSAARGAMCSCKS